MTTDVLASIEARLRELVGVQITEDLGVLQRRDFLRYAHAAGDEEYLALVARLDAEHSAEPRPAPALYLPGILHWAPRPEAELRADGLAPSDAPGVGDEPVNVMHGGQAIELHAPAREGVRVRAERVMRRAERKTGSTSSFLAVVTETRFVDDAGRLLTAVDDTILIVPR